MTAIARRPGEIFARIGPFVKGAAIVPAELGLAVTVKDLDLEESPVINARVAPLRHRELDMELVIGEQLRVS